MPRLQLLASPLLALPLLGAATPAPEAPYKPAYTESGALKTPTQYREWVYLTSGLDMNYAARAANAPPPDHSVFDNVFVNPESYRTFLATGTWSDGTVFALENRSAVANVSINKGGHTQGENITGLEMHVKDKGQWAFYAAQADGTAKPFPKTASCTTCHEAHAAVDTTFVQFYPTLLPIAREKKTLSAKYLQEGATPPPSDTGKTPLYKIK